MSGQKIKSKRISSSRSTFLNMTRLPFCRAQHELPYFFLTPLIFSRALDVSLALAICLCLCSRSLAAGPTTQRPMLSPDIAAALAKNAEQLEPVTVSWKREMRPALSPAETLKQLSLKSGAPFFGASNERETLQGTLFYQRSEPLDRKTVFVPTKSGLAGFVPEPSETSFDGHLVYFGKPESTLNGKLRPELIREAVALKSHELPAKKATGFTYFWAAGFAVPGSYDELARQVRLSSRETALLGTGANLKSVSDFDAEGSVLTCIELEAPDDQILAARATNPQKLEKSLRDAGVAASDIQTRIESLKEMASLAPVRDYSFYLDPKRQYALVRFKEKRADGTLLLQGDNSQFERLPGRTVWLPKSCRIQYYNWKSAPAKVFPTPILYLDLTVDAFDTSRKPLERFALDYKVPGTIVVDNTSPAGQVEYQVPPDTREVETTFKNAKPLGVAGQRSRYWIGVVAGGVGLMVAALAVWWFGRRTLEKGPGNEKL